jgi:VIT1/CCC1 family predicted Fe2+/Mn2+ transporter
MAVIFKNEGEIEWRIQDFFPKREVQMRIQSLSAILGAFFYIYSAYFILKNLTAKGCVYL